MRDLPRKQQNFVMSGLHSIFRMFGTFIELERQFFICDEIPELTSFVIFQIAVYSDDVSFPNFPSIDKHARESVHDPLRLLTLL